MKELGPKGSSRLSGGRENLENKAKRTPLPLRQGEKTGPVKYRECRKAEEILSNVLDLVKKEVSAGRHTFAIQLEKMG